MDKENRHMHRNPRPLSAWRAGLTAAALAGAVGCGPMRYVGVAGGPKLLNVRDSIAAAGGMTSEAGTVITFMPTRARRQAADGSDPACGTSGQDAAVDGAPVVVNTAELDDETRRAFFSMPVREGDVLRVQTAGNFYTTGWFDKPGAYPLHAGLTLRAAIAEAQGLG